MEKANLYPLVINLLYNITNIGNLYTPRKNKRHENHVHHIMSVSLYIMSAISVDMKSAQTYHGFVVKPQVPPLQAPRLCSNVVLVAAIHHQPKQPHRQQKTWGLAGRKPWPFGARFQLRPHLGSVRATSQINPWPRIEKKQVIKYKCSPDKTREYHRIFASHAFLCPSILAE